MRYRMTLEEVFYKGQKIISNCRFGVMGRSSPGPHLHFFSFCPTTERQALKRPRSNLKFNSKLEWDMFSNSCSSHLFVPLYPPFKKEDLLMCGKINLIFWQKTKMEIVWQIYFGTCQFSRDVRPIYTKTVVLVIYRDYRTWNDQYKEGASNTSESS